MIAATIDDRIETPGQEQLPMLLHVTTVVRAGKIAFRALASEEEAGDAALLPPELVPLAIGTMLLAMQQPATALASTEEWEALQEAKLMARLLTTICPIVSTHCRVLWASGTKAVSTPPGQRHGPDWEGLPPELAQAEVVMLAG